MYAEVLCTRPHNPGSLLLRLALFSRWSHSAVLHEGEGMVYEATEWHGVRRVPVDEFFARYTRSERRPIDVPAVLDQGARQWLIDQIGKRYDWTAVLGFITRYFTGAQWHDDDSWFCSEFSEAFRSRFSRARFRAEAWRITPGHQDMAL